ncbi:MAG: Ureidoglycolate lyase [Firmicutes bacterium ADurb.Bin193]|nr:MAG: Ureidoglycolate lyase [Firmicutes bacterium ADurb.Bin193]
MNIIRFLHMGKIHCGALENGVIKFIEGNIFDTYFVTEKTVDLSEVKILPPCEPSKIVCVGLNYKDHQLEMNDFADEFPKLFIKPSTAVIAHGDSIVRPVGVNRVDYEAELAVVIGKKARNIPKGKANDYILGYTCFNDVTAREIQKQDGQWTRSKSFDTFAPLGPYTVTGIDPSNLDIRLLLNGEVKQSSNTKNLIWGIDFLVEEISKIMTLLPGDVISTGTPAGCGEIKDGDTVSVEIEKVGILTNYLTGGV